MPPALVDDHAPSTTPNPQLAASTKRKRHDLDSLSDPLNTINNNGTATSPTSTSFRDLLNVLKRYDTNPSVLEFSFLRDSREIVTKEPSPKRVKTLQDQSTGSIASKVHHGNYLSIHDLRHDFDTACSKILEFLNSQHQSYAATTDWQWAPQSPEATGLAAQLKVLKKYLDGITEREFLSRNQDASKQEDVDSRPPSIKYDDITHQDFRNPDTDGRVMLTLFGNAQGHKQLFSSLQKPLQRRSLSGEKAARRSNSNEDDAAIAPFRENGLPGGISSTRVLLVQANETPQNHKKPPLFREMFPPPAHLPSLLPPKPSRHSNARGSSVTWTSDSASDFSRKLDYTTHKLPTGLWLGYGGVSSAQEPSSPEAKRKRRDRALSMGEASLIPSEESKIAEAKAKEEALFRSVYSSFAPCKDDLGALVPEQVKNQVWWERVGRQSLDSSASIDPALLEAQGEYARSEVEADEDAAFRKTIDEFDEIVDVPTDDPTKISGSDEASSEALMNEVSDLLEKLQSFQRIRKSSLNHNARSNIGQLCTLQAISGTPTTPTDQELETYNTVRTRLADLVGHMPPHVLSKIGGEQLSDLIVSRHVPVEGKDYKGILEDDQVSRSARAAALNAALGATGGARQNATAGARTAQMSQQNRSSAMPPYAGGANSVPRPPYQRQPLAGWQSPAQAMTSSVQRPSYSQQASYTRPPAGSYVNNRPSSSQQPNGAGGHQTPSQPQYQQRAQSWNGSPFSRGPGAAQAPQLAPPSMQRPSFTSNQSGSSPQSRPQQNGAQGQMGQTVSNFGSPSGSAIANRGQNISTSSSRPETPQTSASNVPPKQAGPSPGVAGAASVGGASPKGVNGTTGTRK